LLSLLPGFVTADLLSYGMLSLACLLSYICCYVPFSICPNSIWLWICCLDLMRYIPQICIVSLVSVILN
jgi:hypothetical protein